jgi:hypothetical protein
MPSGDSQKPVDSLFGREWLREALFWRAALDEARLPPLTSRGVTSANRERHEPNVSTAPRLLNGRALVVAGGAASTAA